MTDATPVVWVEKSPFRVRAEFGEETIVDTTAALVLHELGHGPTYYLPTADVRFDLLTSTDRATTCPRKGEASYWTIRVGDRVAENAVWAYREPIDSCPDISDYVAFYWDRMDAWYEDDHKVLSPTT
ncbi:MAG: hypothetical protein QOG64_2315 [Acidimicrobiaceae bacterium]|nr:hypothetical protein [Acidimicrobiaceae bacterium]